MTELDSLIKDKLVPLRRRMVDALRPKYPEIFAAADQYLADPGNRVGLRVLENGKAIGDYTLKMEGAYISDVESGRLDSQIRHPLGVIKPYLVVEKSALERMVADEQRIIEDPFGAIQEYLKDTTIKFLQ